MRQSRSQLATVLLGAFALALIGCPSADSPADAPGSDSSQATDGEIVIAPPDPSPLAGTWSLTDRTPHRVVFRFDDAGLPTLYPTVPTPTGSYPLPGYGLFPGDYFSLVAEGGHSTNHFAGATVVSSEYLETNVKIELEVSDTYNRPLSFSRREYSETITALLDGDRLFVEIVAPYTETSGQFGLDPDGNPYPQTTLTGTYYSSYYADRE